MQIHSKYHEYYLTERIRQYEYGDVYLAQGSEDAGTEFVVKIFSIQLLSLRERQRFLQEVNLLSSLRHPALLSLLDAGIDKGGYPYLVRAYAPGGSLITRLAQQDELAFPQPTVLAILTRIGAAITSLHQAQISHGGLKPENILFDADGLALLADPHISSLNPEIPSTVYEPVLTEKGLVRLQHPVFAVDDRQSGIQADLYTFSSMAYELLTGYQPFSSINQQSGVPVPPSHWVPSFPHQVDSVFLQAFSPQLEERFGSAVLFVEALQQALAPPSVDISTSTGSDEHAPSDAQQGEVASQSSSGRQLVPLQPQSVLRQEPSTRALIVGQQAPQRHHIFADLLLSIAHWFHRRQASNGAEPNKKRRSKGRFPFTLPIIVLTALLILFSILIPFFLFNHRTPPVASRQRSDHAFVKHEATPLPTASPYPTAIPTKRPEPTPTAAPTPTSTPVPAPLPLPLVTNASFEVPALSGDYEYSPADAGWTFSGDCGIAGNGSTILEGGPNAPSGVQVAFLQAYGTIDQNVSFEQGTYRISFLAAQRVNSSSTQSLWVLIDNTVVGSFTPSGGSYLYYTTPGFMVSSGIHTLQFKGLKGGSHNTVFIDSVSVIH